MGDVILTADCEYAKHEKPIYSNKYGSYEFENHTPTKVLWHDNFDGSRTKMIHIKYGFHSILIHVRFFERLLLEN